MCCSFLAKCCRKDGDAPGKRKCCCCWGVLAVVVLVVALAALYAVFRDPREPADPAAKRDTIDAFIQTYFTSWSNKDFGTYRACFDESARVWYVMADGAMRAADLREFIALQRSSHSNSKLSLREFPVKAQSTEWGDVAQVRVYWRLEEGKVESFGNDFFTLVKGNGEWRIASLVFNSEDAR